MTIERLQEALAQAYRLLVYAGPDTELVSASEWQDDCDKWLDTFAPSKVRAAEPAGGCIHCGDEH